MSISYKDSLPHYCEVETMEELMEKVAPVGSLCRVKNLPNICFTKKESSWEAKPVNWGGALTDDGKLINKRKYEDLKLVNPCSEIFLIEKSDQVKWVSADEGFIYCPYIPKNLVDVSFNTDSTFKLGTLTDDGVSKLKIEGTCAEQEEPFKWTNAPKIRNW